MPAQQIPPPEGSYRFVLRRYDLAPEVETFWSTYTETAQTRDIVLGGKRAMTLFLQEEPGRDRALKLGWQDETEQWNARPRWADPWAEGNPLAELDPVAQAVLRVLLQEDGWVEVESVISASGRTADEVSALAKAQNRTKDRLVAVMGSRLAATAAARAMVGQA